MVGSAQTKPPDDTRTGYVLVVDNLNTGTASGTTTFANDKVEFSEGSEAE